MSRAVRGLALAVALLVAACGSTVPQARRNAGAGSTGAADELSGSPAGQGATADEAAQAADTSATAATGSTGNGGQASGRSGSGGASSSTGGKTALKVQGVTDTEIRVGYGTQQDADQSAGGFGLNAVFGDQEAQAHAVVDDINKRGGVLGHKLTLVFHDEKTANDNANPDVTATAQCQDWTRDRPVFAGINIVGDRNRDSFFSCMAKAHTPALYSDLATHSLNDLAKYAPYLYAPGEAMLERFVPTWIDRLNAMGYFTGWDTATGGAGPAPVKVGVPYTDDDSGRRYFDVVKKALASIGRKADDSFAFNADTSALAQIPQVVLRFRSNGITHVLLPASAYLVTPVAERQGYRPRYGMTTIDGLSSLTLTTSPAAQLHGVLGVGWFPASDVDAAHDPGDVSPNETRCKKDMADAGQATTDRLTLTVQLINCDLFFMLADSLTRAGEISPTALQQGAASLGTSFLSAFTFAEHFGPGRYDGAAAARDLGYDDGCACFRYRDAVNRPFAG